MSEVALLLLFSIYSLFYMRLVSVPYFFSIDIVVKFLDLGCYFIIKVTILTRFFLATSNFPDFS